MIDPKATRRDSDTAPTHPFSRPDIDSSLVFQDCIYICSIIIRPPMNWCLICRNAAAVVNRKEEVGEIGNGGTGRDAPGEPSQ